MSNDNDNNYKIDITTNINTIVDKHKKYYNLNYKIEFYIITDNINKNKKNILKQLNLTENLGNWYNIELDKIKESFNKINTDIKYIIENENINKKGYIYCLSADKSEVIYKVGCTHDIKSRLSQHRTSSINNINLEFYIESDDYRKTEKNIHNNLKLNKIERLNNTEWFKCDKTIILDLFKKESEDIKYNDKLNNIKKKNKIENNKETENNKEKDIITEYYNIINKIANKEILNKELIESNNINILNEKINKYFLNLTKNELYIVKNKLSKENYYYKNKKILNKIDMLFWFEELLKINRFDIEKINYNDDEIIKLKELLLKDENINKLLILESRVTGLQFKKNSLLNKINNLNTINRIKKLIVDYYNQFGDIFTIDKIKKIKQKNKIRKRFNIYFFKFNNDI